MDDDLLSLKEFCEIARFGPAGYRHARQKGQVPDGLRIGRRLFFRRQDVETWMREVRMKPVESKHHPPPP